jgi:Mg2+-importing ATPase
MGDGINDAPSLHTADVGMSVVSGVEVATDTAKIILLEKDLAVLNDGVIEAGAASPTSWSISSWATGETGSGVS